MANGKGKKSVRRNGATGVEALLAQLGGDAQRMIVRNRAEVTKAVQKFRKEVERRAERTERAVREVERKILKQLHIATEEQVQRLETRLARLERRASS